MKPVYSRLFCRSMDKYLLKNPVAAVAEVEPLPSCSSACHTTIIDLPMSVDQEQDDLSDDDEEEVSRNVSVEISTGSPKPSVPSPNLKKTLKAKKPKGNKFSAKWLQVPEFSSWLTKSRNMRGQQELAFCKICNINISAHKSEIQRHLKSERHKNLGKQISNNKSVSEVISQSTSNLDVKRAELKFAALLAENNLPFSLMDKLIPLCKTTFKDSKIASKLGSKRTKTTAIIKKALGPSFSDSLFKKLETPGCFFSMIMDETTDMSSKKQCALSVIFFDTETSQVKAMFFDMYEMKSGTADDLYNSMINSIVSKNIPLDNLIGFSSDTCNVMVGKYNSVFSHLKENHPSIVCIKCTCHSIHLAASKACFNLPRSVEDLLRNVGSYFSRSFSRQEDLKNMQIFFGEEIHKILYPGQTRWLSIEQCVNRVLEQYLVLKAYLNTAIKDDPSSTLQSMLSTMDNPFTLAYLEFMSFTLGKLNEFNTMFQSELPLLHCLQPEVEKLIKDICTNYMEVKYVKSISDVMEISHSNPRNFVPLDQVYVGVSTAETINSLKNDPNVSTQSMEQFFKTCLNFYVELAGQIKARFDFSDPLFKLIQFVQPNIAQDDGFLIKSLAPLLHRFPILKNFVNPQKIDSEWKAHNLLDHTNLELDPSKPVNEYWEKVFKLKSNLGVELFPNLKILVRFILTLPFSNAKVERLFSEVKLTKTAHRNKLKTDTLVALLATKEGLKSEGGCVQFEPTNQMMKTNIWS